MTDQIRLIAEHLNQTGQLVAPVSAEQVPDTATAYAVQQEIVRQRGTTVGGWKIGLAAANGPVQGSALPADGLLPSGVSLPRAGYVPGALELEIAFRFKRSFAPRSEPWSDAEVYAGIGSVAATLEVVASRYQGWPKVTPLAMLADLLNHGALIVGEFVEYREDFVFNQPALSLTFDGKDIVSGPGANPAGDPRLLLPWLVNHYSRQGLTLTPETVITTGSYTGLFTPEGPGLVHGVIEGLPAVAVELV